MSFPSETEVRSILSEFEGDLFDIVHGAWQKDWLNNPDRGRYRFPRTRANIVFDHIISRALAVFDDNPKVRIFLKDETAKFLIADRVLVRFKKANGSGVGSNIETQAVLNFIDPQLSLPGVSDEVQRVEICYITNELQTRIDRIVVTARNCKDCLWSYELKPMKSAEVTPISSPSEPPKRKGTKVRPKEIGTEGRGKTKKD